LSRRASHSEQAGAGGVAGAKVDFIAIGWGPMENDHHDIGTDLVIWVRDSRLFDLGRVVGVQVKGGERQDGKSWFRHPKKASDGAIEGWWYSEKDRSHFDAWASSSVPHLLVLHDIESKTSYWVHITPESIVSTGKGAKVLVPRSNTVDKEHLPELLKVAAFNQVRTNWEGSSWNNAQDLLPENQWRYAAMVPRLVAPHPNSFPDEPITAPEAFAMLVQCRFQDLHNRLQGHSTLPSLPEAQGHADWGWRLVGSFAQYLSDGNVEGIKDRVNEAQSEFEECVSTVTLACAHLNQDQPERALQTLEETIGRDQAGPVDHAWLLIQRGRIQVELGDVTAARSDAFEALAVGDQNPEDLTATDLAGSAAALIFNTSSIEEKDVKNVITAADTVAGWWLAQEQSRGLSHVVDRTYKQWTRDESTITFGAEDQAATKLLASALAANFSADHGSWRRAIGLMGMDALLRVDRHSEAMQAAKGIEFLRVSGDSKALKVANVRLQADGPSEALVIVGSSVNLAKSTKTTVITNLELLGQSGDVLPTEIADRNVRWLRQTLADPKAFIERTSPSFLLDVKIVETMEGLIPSCSREVLSMIAEDISRLEGCENQLKARVWARIAQGIPAEAWTNEQIAGLKAQADGHDFLLRFAALGIVASRDQEVKDLLLAEADEGSTDALSALGSVRQLPSSTISNMVPKLASQIEEIIIDARNGTHGGGLDPTHTLAMLNVWHPAEADWGAIVSLLGEPAVSAESKAGTMAFLGFHPEQMPVDVRERIGLIAKGIATGEISAPSYFGQGSRLVASSAKFALVVGSFDEDESSARIVRQLAGSSMDRRWVAHAISARNEPTETPLLVGLITDPDPHVRSAAAAFVAGRSARGECSPIEQSALSDSLSDPGIWVPVRIAEVLADAGSLPSSHKQLVDQLLDHRSAQVRSIAQEINFLEEPAQTDL